jgi:hypothetical protein
MANKSQNYIVTICCGVLMLIGGAGIYRGVSGLEKSSTPLAQASLDVLDVDTGLESEEAVQDPACLEESCHTDEIRTGYQVVSALED